MPLAPGISSTVNNLFTHQEGWSVNVMTRSINQSTDRSDHNHPHTPLSHPLPSRFHTSYTSGHVVALSMSQNIGAFLRSLCLLDHENIFPLYLLVNIPD